MFSKKKRSLLSILCVLCLVFASVHVNSGVVMAKDVSEKCVRIMPLGDSITDCDFWRTMLYNQLIDNDYNVEFVGSRGTHEGHSGMLVTDLAKTNDLATWLSGSNPDIVMMHFGTNDLFIIL